MTSALLEQAGLSITRASTVGEACAHLEKTAFDVIVTDFFVDTVEHSGGWTGIDKLLAKGNRTPVGIVSGTRLSPTQLIAHDIAFAFEKPTVRIELLDAIVGCIRAPEVDPAVQQVVRAYFTCLERGDWDGLAKVCTPDVVYRVPGGDPRFSQVVRGIDELKRIAAETFSQFVEPRFVVTSMRALPVGAIVRYEASWKDAGAARGAMFVRFAGERIAEVEIRLDLAKLQS